MWVHIDATWRIRLNRPCAAVMRPYVKLLDHLLLLEVGLYAVSQISSIPTVFQQDLSYRLRYRNIRFYAQRNAAALRSITVG